MNRRGFLQMMVGGVAAAAAVRTFPFRVFSFPPAPVYATISSYADFARFTLLTEETAIDPVVAKAAEELGYRAAALTIDQLVRMQFLLSQAKVEANSGKFYGVIHPAQARAWGWELEPS